MKRSNFLTGQVYGKVDWVSQDNREVGLYIRTSGTSSTRCVLRGATIEDMLATKGVLHEGMMVTASGMLHARCLLKKSGERQAEVVCTVDRIAAECGSPVRVRGALHACLKGVVMYWDARTSSAKTFFNFNSNTPEMPAKVLCSIYLKQWVEDLAPIKKERFLTAMRAGREFTLAGVTEASSYIDKDGLLVPTLTLLPLDFKLQG